LDGGRRPPWGESQPVAYEEMPGAWAERERFAFHRVLKAGPLREYRMTTTLAAGEWCGTHVTFELSLELCWPFARPVAWFNGNRTLDAFVREARRTDAVLVAGRRSLTRPRARARTAAS
jgi:hypothetical protein